MYSYTVCNLFLNNNTALSISGQVSSRISTSCERDLPYYHEVTEPRCVVILLKLFYYTIILPFTIQQDTARVAQLVRAWV